MTKVIFCVPSLHGPSAPFIRALEDSLPLVVAAGFEEGAVEERGNPYISYARSTMLRKALDAKADMAVFIDYDVSWRPHDLLKLIETPGEVVAGTYRFKKDEEEYMGGFYTTPEGRPIVREGGVLKSSRVPAGFLKITKEGVDRFMRAYPNLTYGPRYNPSVDLFNHGVLDDGIWYGEDMAFSKRWSEADEENQIVLIPDLGIDHHQGDKVYKGNLHEWLLRRPGGSHHGDSDL